jgi:hypothetical protein
MSKAITTPVTVANLTRMACLRYSPHFDDTAGTLDYCDVTIQARPANAQAGTDEATRIASGYQPVVLRITDGACDTYLPNGASYRNQYNDAFVKGTAALTGVLTAVMTAVDAATKNQKNDAVLTALAAAGILPPLT